MLPAGSRAVLAAGARSLAQDGLSGVRALAAAGLRALGSAAPQQQPQQQQAQQALPEPQPWPRHQQQQHWPAQRAPRRGLASSAGALAAAAAAAAEGAAAAAPRKAAPPPVGGGSAAAAGAPDEQELDKLLQVLLHPMPRAPAWNAQLSPYLLQVNEQLLLQPSAVLLSVLRALHVIRGVLQEDGHVYVVGTNRLLAPLVQAAARACLNPNVWWYGRTWSPGMLTNYASHRRLFKEAHQPNRRLLATKGYRMVNPLCPAPPPSAAPLPRLSWADKWLLQARTRRPGYRRLLEELLHAEDKLHRFKPAGSLRGQPRSLRLVVFLDTTKNSVAVREAHARNIATVGLVNAARDVSLITYPVLARDSNAEFARFFLDWLLKVANAPPGAAPGALGALLREAGTGAAARRRGGGDRAA
ncbi:rpsB [Scenedesmus sp. PABB004]|nr:rpsB [Scenedesmus sp. PABB004]